ncbi:MAG TPA: hypothetical protein VMQ50_15095 [Casimicrobiaceae bacterium]|nr:hypothetical protein [Casimicrobiaceae bacterium]
MKANRTLQRTASIRGALILAVMALMFFGAIIAVQRLGSSMIWLGAFAVAVIGLPLAAAVGRRGK